MLPVPSAARSAYAGAQQSPLDPQGSVAVVVTCADGRRAPMTVGPTSGGGRFADASGSLSAVK